MPTDTPYPLAAWAERQVRHLAEMTGAPALRDLRGAGLLVERALLNGFRVPGMISAGGGCRLLAARDGWVALNLARPDDRDLLPALFRDDFTPDDAAIAAQMATASTPEIVARGREMGLALAHWEETPASPPTALLSAAPPRPAPTHPPLVVDLSALWAGPLAAHLLWLAGARVVKVESRTRPDVMRDGDPALFALLNQGKASVVLDFQRDRDALLRLIARADIVIEAARPRALRQLGIDADAIVRASPGLSWITITGHGAQGEAADWIGFGDDCAVAGGLAGRLRRVTGRPGFVGDALADPLTGLVAANIAWSRWASGEGGRVALAMSAIASRAAAEDATLDASLRHWASTVGTPFPAFPVRIPTAPVAPFGRDTAEWLSC